MTIKYFLLACVMVYLCGASGGKLKTNLLDDVCKESNTPECREKAKKCMAPRHELTPEERKKLDKESCNVFRTCVGKDAKVKNAYDTFVKEKHGGKDWCSNEHLAQHRNEHPEGNKVHFTEYLAQAAGPAAVAELKCCLAKEEGKFDGHGKVIVDAWKKGAAMIVDAAAKAALIKGITECAAGHPICSVDDFKVCVIKKCLHAIK